MDNANGAEYLEKIKVQVIENLKRTTHAPSVQMTDVPRDPEGLDDEADKSLDDADEDENKDARWTKRRWDKYIEKEGELSESEDEEENERNGVRRQAGTKRRRNMMDYQNMSGGLNDDEEMGSGAASEKRGRSREPNGNTSGANGSLHSDVADSALSNDNSDDDLDEEDTEMVDPSNAMQVNGAVPHPQEATPPDSPPEVNAAAEASISMDGADETGERNPDEGAMDREAGREERDAEDVMGEKETEVAERREESP